MIDLRKTLNELLPGQENASDLDYIYEKLKSSEKLVSSDIEKDEFLKTLDKELRQLSTKVLRAHNSSSHIDLTAKPTTGTYSAIISLTSGIKSHFNPSVLTRPKIK